jgi:hypothetical protein
MFSVDELVRVLSKVYNDDEEVGESKFLPPPPDVHEFDAKRYSVIRWNCLAPYGESVAVRTVTTRRQTS